MTPTNTSGAGRDPEGQPLSSADRCRVLVEANPAQLWTARPDGGLDYVNPMVASYAGMPAELLLGDGCGRMIHPLDLSRAAEQWRKCLATGEPYSVEMRLQCGADSIYRWRLTNVEPFHDPGGAIVQWVGTNVNIDEQKRAVEVASSAQAYVTKERERLRRLIHHAPAAMALYSGPSFVIELMNPAAQEIAGNRAAQGKPVREVFPEMESQGVFDLLERAYATGEPHQAVEMRVVFDRDGDGVAEETFWNVTVQPLNDPGEPTTEILSHSIEVTALVLARRERESSQ